MRPLDCLSRVSGSTSERQKSTAAHGKGLQEASVINKSLLRLGHVINSLVDREAGKVRQIPFRNSNKRTVLLRDTLGGNSKPRLVTAVSSSVKSEHETEETEMIQNDAVLNEDTCEAITALQAEMDMLRTQLEGYAPTPSHPNEEMSLNQSKNMLIYALKRQVLRVEGRGPNLEKQVIEEDRVVQGPKRKIREEVMNRKFKERRLSNPQTSTNTHLGRDDQNRMMNEEIASLHKRLSIPSTEAIEWKVVHEGAKETLGNKIKEDGMDIMTLEDKIQELDATIERLCNEKGVQKEMIPDLTLSSPNMHSDLCTSTDGSLSRTNSENLVLDDVLSTSVLSTSVLSTSSSLSSRWQTNTSFVGIEAVPDSQRQLRKSLEMVSTDQKVVSSQIDDVKEKLKQIEQRRKERIEINDMKKKLKKMEQRRNERTLCFQESAVGKGKSLVGGRHGGIETGMTTTHDKVQHQEKTMSRAAISATDQIKELKSDLQRSNIIGNKRKKDFSLPEQSPCHLSAEVEILNETVQEKSEHIVESEMLREIWYELQITFDGLRDKLNESRAVVTDKEYTQIGLQKQLAAIQKIDIDFHEQINMASSQIDIQKSMVCSLEDKTRLLEIDKNIIIEKLRYENRESKKTFTKEIDSLREEIKRISEERFYLKSELCTVKKKAEVECSAATNEKESVIIELQGKISEMRISHERADQAAKLDKEHLEKKILSQKGVMKEMERKLEMLNNSFQKDTIEMEVEHDRYVAKSETKHRESECNLDSQLQEDELKLLNRKKGTIETSEFKTIRDDQGLLSSNILFPEAQNMELGMEQCSFKRQIENMEQLRSNIGHTSSAVLQGSHTPFNDFSIKSEDTFENVHRGESIELNDSFKCQIEDMDKLYSNTEHTPSTASITNLVSPPSLRDSHALFNDLSIKLDDTFEKMTIDQSIELKETFDDIFSLPVRPQKLRNKSLPTKWPTPSKLSTLSNSDCSLKSQSPTHKHTAESHVELLLSEDKCLLTDYSFQLIKQLRLCHFTEGDRKSRGGKRENITIGYGGLQCMHCHASANPRKYFWSKVDCLANSFAKIGNHILNCPQCPEQTKVLLRALKADHHVQMSKLERGSQKIFFRRMWRRIHNKDATSESVIPAVCETFETSKQPSPKGKEDLIKIEEITRNDTATFREADMILKDHKLKANDSESSQGDFEVKARSEMIDLSAQQTEQRLYAYAEDKEWIPDMDHFVQENMGVFCAPEQDVSCAQSEKLEPTVVGDSNEQRGPWDTNFFPSLD